jgi:hypothetical protein
LHELILEVAPIVEAEDAAPIVALQVLDEPVADVRMQAHIGRGLAFLMSNPRCQFIGADVLALHVEADTDTRSDIEQAHQERREFDIEGLGRFNDPEGIFGIKESVRCLPFAPFGRLRSNGSVSP